MITGIKNLHKITVGLSQFSKQIKDTAFQVGMNEMLNLKMDMILRTPIDTGLASSSWSAIIRSGNELSFQLDVPYGLVLDIGSTPGSAPWRSPGPRTKLYKGRIYSSQVADGAGGIVAEVLDDDRMVHITNVIGQKIGQELKNVMD